MEHVNNDMDDLFRKAGEQYPLRSSGSDWEGVLGKVKEENLSQEGSAVADHANKNKRRRWGLILLLVPVALGSVIYYKAENKKIPGISSITKTIVPVTKQAGDNLPDESTGKKESSVQPVTPPRFSGNRKNIPATALSVYHLTGRHTGKYSRPVNTGPAGFGLNSPGAGTRKDREGKGLLSGSTTSPNPVSAVLLSETKTKPVPVTGSSAGAATFAAIAGKPVATPDSGIAKKTGIPDSLSSRSTVKKEASTIKSRKGFYAGVLAGPDWTAVKFQSVQQTGYSFGLLAGYHFNGRLALESGFLLDRKFYYSSGEYFSTSKTGIPVNQPVNSVMGNCVMIEIPVNFRVDFATRKNHNFFAVAGLSSYLMKKETYSINFQGASPWNYPDTSYYNSTKNLFSVLQLSAGYEHAIGPNTNIRIEPYIKIPLQGIGIGSLPIASAGIYFGITYFFK
jgi:hypothetical protein